MENGCAFVVGHAVDRPLSPRTHFVVVDRDTSDSLRGQPGEGYSSCEIWSYPDEPMSLRAPYWYTDHHFPTPLDVWQCPTKLLLQELGDDVSIHTRARAHSWRTLSFNARFKENCRLNTSLSFHFAYYREFTDDLSAHLLRVGVVGSPITSSDAHCQIDLLRTLNLPAPVAKNNSLSENNTISVWREHEVGDWDTTLVHCIAQRRLDFTIHPAIHVIPFVTLGLTWFLMKTR